MTQVSKQPTWEDYYNYSQQLYAAGHRQQAEAYYRQAQLLFNQAENPQRNQSPAAYRADSYSPPQATHLTINSPALSVVSPPAREYTDSIPAKKPKRSLKKRLKIWTVTSLVVVLSISIGGFIGLFYFYKYQLRQGATERPSDSSILGQVQEMTLNPMVDLLQPAFDKAIRLSLAAQPLLYELNLRDALPEDLYSETSNTSLTSREKETPALSLPKTDDINAIAETNASMAQTDEKAETSPASADAEESDSRAVTLPERQAPADKAVIASNIEVREDASNEKKASSSRAGGSRKSVRQKSERVSNNVEEIETTAPQKNASPLGNALPAEDAPLSGRQSETKELDDLLAPKPKAPQQTGHHSADTPMSSVQNNLSRSDVQQGMMRVAPAVKNCSQGNGGIISMNVVIGENGRVSSAVATGVHAGTPIGVCAARAVRRAVFPTSRQSLNVKYPFQF